MTQLIEMSADANVSNNQVRGLILRRSPTLRTAATTTTISTKHHTMRWARISNALAGFSSGKKAGNRPQDAYAPTPNSKPDLRGSPLTVLGCATHQARAADRLGRDW